MNSAARPVRSHLRLALLASVFAGIQAAAADTPPTSTVESVQTAFKAFSAPTATEPEKRAAWERAASEIRKHPASFVGADFRAFRKMADALGEDAIFSALIDKAIEQASEEHPQTLCRLLNYRADFRLTRENDPKGSEADCRRAMDFGKTCPFPAYSACADRLYGIYVRDGRTEAACETRLSVLRRPESNGAWVAKHLFDAGASPETLETALRELRRKSATAGGSALRNLATTAQPEAIKILIALGRPAEAACEARTALSLALDSAWPRLSEYAARALKAADGNAARAASFLEFVSEPLSEAKRKPSVRNPLADFPRLRDSVRDAESDRLEQSPAPSSWREWLDRSSKLCWLDRPVDATEAAMTAFALCPMTENALAECARAATRPALAATRDETLAAAIVDWMLYGPAGKDSKMGTSDDLDAPLSALRAVLGGNAP